MKPNCVARAGLDLTLPNKQGHTALHKAAYKGHDALCHWLLANTALGCCSASDGCCCSSCCVGFRRDAGGYTPAMIAREQRHEALAEWLQLKQDESASHCRCCRRRREQALDTPAGRARAAAGQVKKRSF